MVTRQQDQFRAWRHASDSYLISALDRSKREIALSLAPVARKTASMAASDSGIDMLTTVEIRKDERAGPINAS
jgi:hypothetical protein